MAVIALKPFAQNIIYWIPMSYENLDNGSKFI